MDMERKRKQSFLLRLPTSIREQATELAREEGTSINHFISIAVAEKISRMRQRSATRGVAAPAPAAHLLMHLQKY